MMSMGSWNPQQMGGACGFPQPAGAQNGAQNGVGSVPFQKPMRDYQRMPELYANDWQSQQRPPMAPTSYGGGGLLGNSFVDPRRPDMSNSIFSSMMNQGPRSMPSGRSPLSGYFG